MAQHLSYIGVLWQGRAMTARAAQRLIGVVFLILGGWALLAPGSVIALTIRPAYREASFLSTFAIACFGAQACLFALVAFTARFTRATFAWFGAALLPFFAFDWYFYSVVPALTVVGLLDAAGNVAMLGLCWLGWRAADTLPRTV